MSGSSAVARIARPSEVCLRKRERPPSRATARAKISARDVADAELVRDLQAVEGEVADHVAERTGVRAINFEQHVLERDREAEGRQQRHEHAGAQAALQNPPLQEPADRRHDRHDRDEREERRNAGVVRDREDEECGEHREIAMREIDDAHDAEHQRQAASKQSIIAAEQNALHNEIDHAHAAPRATFPARWRPK